MTPTDVIVAIWFPSLGGRARKISNHEMILATFCKSVKLPIRDNMLVDFINKRRRHNTCIV
ncbi:hypothetical protein BKH46_08620 [Helicobacter sp. 12S02634-8]|uniref:hypothetical protein n=1 Tax=Helicobacter sp. 12S02634-8 TaxID=1476199 RepID=UPI000BA75F3C|nr:hypothetical protein [Helicobacter sp. 12S02634-8]PAF46190.1 hypothetical protein BKH46_08620 [Helicobacter sp. 12S02634-8]